MVYSVAHFVGGCSFDELPNSTAHGGTVVNNKESGSARTGHQSEKLLLFIAKNNSRETRLPHPKNPSAHWGKVRLKQRSSLGAGWM